MRSVTMTVTLTINGQRVVAPDGSTILEAARGAGIRIPTLCHHPDLSNVGACRLCVVSVEKARGLQTACTTPAFNGMVVNTESQDARDTRKFVLNALLTDHPNDCMRCEVNGACELQDLVYEYEVPWPEHDGARHQYPVNPDPNPFIFVDLNKCILCGRCVRGCTEIQNRDVWAFANRGFKSKLVAGADQNLLDARCESCGQCVSYCPVGALFDKMSLGWGRPSQVTKVRTTCSYCGVGCNYDLNVRDGRIVRVTSASDAPVNGRALCVKGRYGYDYVHHPDRLTRPLVRAKWLDPEEVAARTASGEWTVEERWQVAGSRSQVDGFKSHRRRQPAEGSATFNLQPSTSNPPSPFIAVDWDTALDVVTRKFAAVKQENGGEAFAVLTSAKCTNEENFLVNKLTRQVLGTNSIDHCARL
jgi:predicted molibdopterin-dependent oxidoreductase YjgC